MVDATENKISERKDYFDYREEQGLIETERVHLETRAKQLGLNDTNYIGLALSGGGIRSASFSIGILQAMAKRDVLKQVDYMSTVSGGGYTGTSLSWFLHCKWKEHGSGARDLQYGVGPEDFPFGTKPNTNTDEPGASSKDKMSILRHLRQNINYLFPGEGIGPQSLIAALTRGIFLNILFYGPMLLLFLMLMAFLMTCVVDGVGIPVMDRLRHFIELAILVAITTAVASLFYGIACTLARRSPTYLYRLRRFYLSSVGLLWVAVGVFFLLGSLPDVFAMLTNLMEGKTWLGGSTITLGGVLSGIWAYVRSGSEGEKKYYIPSGLVVTLSAALLLYGVLFLVYLFASDLLDEKTQLGQLFYAYPYYFIAGVALIFFLGLYINVNFITLHRYYRDRLMELFMPVPKESTINKPAQAAIIANTTYLHQICNYDNGVVGPYHLINTNVMLPGSGITKFRGRGGDNFILSPMYCGSNATGWARTDKFIQGNMTLPTAMSISGAAVNPNTGSNGEGATRSPLLSAIMAFLNLRLGVWVENPNPAYTSKWFSPNLWLPGLRDIFLPTRMNENSCYVELSDGGHFENLGAYELIRREVDLIILCDGAADNDYTFSDFANLVEKVRLDFGTRIDIDLDPLIPKSGKNLPYGLDELAKQGHAIGTIQYRKRNGKEKIGFLIYIKTTIVDNLPADIYGYKLKHPDFPDESTGDQFFDEKQFEAYRELGYQLADRMLMSLPDHLDELLQNVSLQYEWLLIRFGFKRKRD